MLAIYTPKTTRVLIPVVTIPALVLDTVPPSLPQAGVMARWTPSLVWRTSGTRMAAATDKSAQSEAQAWIIVWQFEGKRQRPLVRWTFKHFVSAADCSLLQPLDERDVAL
jgi:hypothetical protein